MYTFYYVYLICCASPGYKILLLFRTAQKMKFSIKDIFSKCDQIRSFLQTWSQLLKKSLTENFIFCAASLVIFHTNFLGNR